MINKLITRIKETNAPIVVGLDPMMKFVPEYIKKAAFAEYGETLEGAAEAIWQYNKGIIDATYDLIPAVKPQIAMYEQFGVPGLVAFNKTCEYAKSKGLVIIGDIKRGDIGSTSKAYAIGHVGKVAVGSKTDSGFCEEIFENHDEKPTNSFLYSSVMDTYSVSGYSAAPFLDMPLNHKVFLAQFETIKKIAEKESCVIVGRCADYALSDNPDCINIFIHADLDVRIKNVSRNLNITENKARDIINKTDKQRASYYNYYTSKKWGDSKSYNLSLDAGKLGTDNCVEMILKFRELMDAMK